MRRDACRLVTLVALAALAASCAHVGKLSVVPQTLTPADTTGGHHPERAVRHTADLHPLTGSDTLVGFQPFTGDSSRRYLGRLREGYTADTINIILVGDNRPDFRSSRLVPEISVIRRGLSPNPVRIGRALITIPWAIVKGLYPDLALIRDIPALVRRMPTYGREHQVLNAILAKVDTLHANGRAVSLVVNTGDLVYDGSRPMHWQRFLRIERQLAARVPYVAVAGNHEKTYTPEGLENWRKATGLPIAGDRMYYCFDSADGWLRFIALDSNPLTHPGLHWSHDVQVKFMNEEIDWLRKRLKEHHGPAFVLMHSPPFSAGWHRTEWENDSLMRGHRDAIVRALHEGGISAMVTGHEHDYERALITWPDGSVLIYVVQGGGGAPLHPLPAPQQAAALFSAYHVPDGGRIDPKNVFTDAINNFSLLRLWYGGGELQTFAVFKDGSTKMVDHLNIDLRRYGLPKIQQKQVAVAPTGHTQPSSMQAKMNAGVSMKADTTHASRMIETHPAPGKHRRPIHPKQHGHP